MADPNAYDEEVDYYEEDEDDDDDDSDIDGPLDGSWVAELEDAKAELALRLQANVTAGDRSNGNDDNDADAEEEDAAVRSMLLVRAHLRVCRAYRMLRQWERLIVAAKRGLVVCRSLAEASATATATTTTTTTTRTDNDDKGEASAAVDDDNNNNNDNEGPKRDASEFRKYRKLARAELNVASTLNTRVYEGWQNDSDDDNDNDDGDDEVEDPHRLAGRGLPVEEGRCFSWMRNGIVKAGRNPNLQFRGDAVHANANIFQDAAVTGDVRMMEAMVALGVAIDLPLGRSLRGDRDKGGAPHGAAVVVTLPADASALVMACVVLAIADSTGPALARARAGSPKYNAYRLDRIEECAMQLVRLGADPNRTLKVLDDRECCILFRNPIFEGKSAIQIAAMSKRRALVALMLQHVQMDVEERAWIVHCRCGSRLPWDECHNTGVGQPGHCVSEPTSPPRIHYRVSPLARCPCTANLSFAVPGKPYYKCCWKDNATPTYLMDGCGTRLCLTPDVGPKSFLWRCLRHQSAANGKECARKVRDRVRRFRESPAPLQELCAELGPKSNMSTWDPVVYAGCLERLDDPFFWTDVHWDLDRSVLIRQAGDWNSALQKYCDDLGLEGEDRDHVFETHRANPCGPCGYSGCDAFETKVREFERCAQCKKIAYCTRECQMRDWDEHGMTCKSDLVYVTEDDANT